MCQEVDIDSEKHPGHCALEVYRTDPHIGSTYYQDWWVSTVLLPGRTPRWEMMITRADVILAFETYEDEKVARYWHIRTVMDIIRAKGEPNLNYIDEKTKLAILLLRYRAHTWCQTHSSWSCGCYD